MRCRRQEKGSSRVKSRDEEALVFPVERGASWQRRALLMQETEKWRGVNLGLQSNGEDMQMVFIKASCDCGGDDYGYWFLSALTLSCTLLAVYQFDLSLCKSPFQISLATRTPSQNSLTITFYTLCRQCGMCYGLRTKREGWLCSSCAA